MLYYAILLVFQNEMGPVNIIEFGGIALMLMAAVIFNALIFGDIYTAYEALTIADRDN